MRTSVGRSGLNAREGRCAGSDAVATSRGSGLRTWKISLVARSRVISSSSSAEQPQEGDTHISCLTSLWKGIVNNCRTLKIER